MYPCARECAIPPPTRFRSAARPRGKPGDGAPETGTEKRGDKCQDASPGQTAGDSTDRRVGPALAGQRPGRGPESSATANGASTFVPVRLSDRALGVSRRTRPLSPGGEQHGPQGSLASRSQSLTSRTRGRRFGLRPSGPLRAARYATRPIEPGETELQQLATFIAFHTGWRVRSPIASLPSPMVTNPAQVLWRSPTSHCPPSTRRWLSGPDSGLADLGGCPERRAAFVRGTVLLPARRRTRLRPEPAQEAHFDRACHASRASSGTPDSACPAAGGFEEPPVDKNSIHCSFLLSGPVKHFPVRSGTEGGSA